MIEPEEQERWNALAAELGLPPEPPETPPPVPAPAATQGPVAAEPVKTPEMPAPAPASTDLGAAEEVAVPARGPRQQSAPSTEASCSPASHGEEDAERPIETALPETPAETVETLAEEERPRRRRRVSSSRKPRKEAAAEASADANAVETAEADEEERPRRRRRRRSKKTDKDSEPLPAAESEEQHEEASPERLALDEEDDEEVEDFSTWNVPSWEEIIAGLYRPEH